MFKKKIQQLFHGYVSESVTGYDIYCHLTIVGGSEGVVNGGGGIMEVVIVVAIVVRRLQSNFILITRR